MFCNLKMEQRGTTVAELRCIERRGFQLETELLADWSGATETFDRLAAWPEKNQPVSL
jgi:hypothetical protein